MAKKDMSSDQAWIDKRAVERAFKANVDFIHQSRNSSKSSQRDTSGPVLKLRRQATLEWLPKIRDRYADRYPELDLPTLWADECSTPDFSMPILDSCYHISLAAALWMLDALESSLHLHRDALPYLEADEAALDAVVIPDIADSSYSDRLIRAMVRLIRCRDKNELCFRSYLNESTAKRAVKLSPAHEASASKPIQDMTDREKFQHLMELIPTDLKEQAAAHFEAQMWSFLDVIFGNAERYRAALQRADQRGKVVCAAAADAQKRIQEETLLQRLEQRNAHGFMDDLKNSCDAINGFVNDIWEAGNQYDDLKSRSQYAFQHAHTAFLDSRAMLTDETSQEDADRLLSLETADPYESCFGFLYLVEQGSTLPWLYNAPMAVLVMAIRQLPWTAFVGESDFDDELWSDEENEEESTPAEPISMEDLTPPDWTEKKAKLYHLSYDDSPLYVPLKSPLPEWKLNLPQLVFGLTHTLMPRQVSLFDETAEDFSQAGMEPGLAQGMELYLQLASNRRGQIDLPPPVDVPSEQAVKELEAELTRKCQQLEADYQDQLKARDRSTEALQAQLNRQLSYQKRLEQEKQKLYQQIEEIRTDCASKLEASQAEIRYLKRKLSQPKVCEDIPSWVRQNFSDRLYLHSRAISLLSDADARSVDVGLICDALDFLATDYWDRRYQNLTTEEMNLRCSQKYGRPFEIKPTGTSTIEYTPSQYKIKYAPEQKGRQEEQALDFHLRVGNAPDNLLRIYFFHDDSKQLIVIGSLPHHLRSVKIR